MTSEFNLFNFPILVLILAFPLFWAAAQIGWRLRERKVDQARDDHDDLTFILGGTLTLLGLIIGFTFSMAVSRYDQRKQYEEGEANAIGTEYLRADLLPAADAAHVRELLRQYLVLRVQWYKARNWTPIAKLDSDTGELQNKLWSATRNAALSQPGPIGALAIAGMNDVINAQGYAQAVWWNRIPLAAWILLTLIAVFCNIQMGFTVRQRGAFLLLILPIALSISLFLIADIDSPRGGVIRVRPQNLESLVASLPH